MTNTIASNHMRSLGLSRLSRPILCICLAAATLEAGQSITLKPPNGATQGRFEWRVAGIGDFDHDDHGVVQRCFSGEDIPADPDRNS